MSGIRSSPSSDGCPRPVAGWGRSGRWARGPNPFGTRAETLDGIDDLRAQAGSVANRAAEAAARRDRAVRLVEWGVPVEEVAEKMGVVPRTVREWVRDAA